MDAEKELKMMSLNNPDPQTFVRVKKPVANNRDGGKAAPAPVRFKFRVIPALRADDATDLVSLIIAAGGDIRQKEDEHTLRILDISQCLCDCPFEVPNDTYASIFIFESIHNFKNNQQPPNPEQFRVTPSIYGPYDALQILLGNTKWSDLKAVSEARTFSSKVVVAKLRQRESDPNPSPVEQGSNLQPVANGEGQEDQTKVPPSNVGESVYSNGKDTSDKSGIMATSSRQLLIKRRQPLRIPNLRDCTSSDSDSSDEDKELSRQQPPSPSGSPRGLSPGKVSKRPLETSEEKESSPQPPARKKASISPRNCSKDGSTKSEDEQASHQALVIRITQLPSNPNPKDRTDKASDDDHSSDDDEEPCDQQAPSTSAPPIGLSPGKPGKHALETEDKQSSLPPKSPAQKKPSSPHQSSSKQAPPPTALALASDTETDSEEANVVINSPSVSPSTSRVPVTSRPANRKPVVVLNRPQLVLKAVAGPSRSRTTKPRPDPITGDQWIDCGAQEAAEVVANLSVRNGSESDASEVSYHSDASASSPSPRVSSSGHRDQRHFKSGLYTLSEDKLIVTKICDQDAFLYTKSRYLWEQMADSKDFRKRTFESLKNRWKRNILPRILAAAKHKTFQNEFGLNKDQIARFVRIEKMKHKNDKKCPKFQF